MNKEARFNQACAELEKDLDEGFITQTQFRIYMRELEEDFAELFEDCE